MNVSVLDRKMRGLYTHHLDVDLDLDLIPGQNLYHPRQIGTRDTPVTGRPDTDGSL